MSAIPAGAGEGLPGRLHDTARQSGPGPALALLYEASGPPGVIVRGPGGHALVPAPAAVPAGYGPGQGAHAPAALRELGIEALGCADVADGPSPVEYHAWVTALLWLRLGLSARLTDAVSAHLGGRTFGGTPLIQHQMVKGELADAVMGRLEVRALLECGGPEALGDAALGGLHGRLTDADRGALTLLGARGFTAPGPGQDAYASELLADVYVRGPGGGFAAPPAPGPRGTAA